MKIIRRNPYVSPISSIIIWLMPLVQYPMLKMSNAIQRNEWIYPMIIVSMFLLWLIANWKLEKQKKKL